MIRKENHFLFYSYFLIALVLSYIGRNILSPTEHYVYPWIQMICIALLPFLYRQTITISRSLSGILFFLSLVLMWELSNLLSFFIGFNSAALLHYYYQINLGLEWPVYILKPLLIFAYLYFNKTRILLYFNALMANKEYVIDASEINKTVLKEVQDSLPDLNFYTPQEAYFYFNELTQILTIFCPSKKGNYIKKSLSICNESHLYMFLNHKKLYNPHAKNIVLDKDMLFIRNKKQTYVFDWNSFSPSLKDIINSIINTVDDDDTEDDGLITSRITSQTTTKPPLFIDNT